MTNFSLEQYRPVDSSLFKKYIRKAYHEKYILGDPRYLDWQYGGQLFLIKAGEDIVGHFGFRDIDYKFYDKIIPARTLMNLFVLEPYRIIGVATLLVKKVFDTQNPIMVFRYKPAAQKLFSYFRPKWRDAGNLKRYMAILNQENPLLSGYKIPEAKIVRHSAPDYEFAEVPFCGKDFCDLWQRVRSRYPISVERNAEYLSWRFNNHPFFKYRILTASKKRILGGYLIWKMEEDRGFKIARIIDFIAAEQAEEALFKEFLVVVKKEGAAAADFLLSGDAHNNALLNAGFFNVGGTDFENFPTLFSPISYVKPFINIGYDFAAPLDDCYFTKAEGDQDRPNPH